MKTQIQQYEEIYDSHINGQGKQMVEQIKNLPAGLYDFPACLEWIEENCQFGQIEALNIVKKFFRIEYR